METSNWISLGSMLIAFLSFKYSVIDRELIKRRIKVKEQELLKKKDDDEKKKKALIEAVSFKDEKSWIIKINNKGKVSAHNIEIISHDKIEDNGRLLFDPHKKHSYPLLPPKSSYIINMDLTLDRQAKPHRLKFIWDDDFQDGNTREQVLDL